MVVSSTSTTIRAKIDTYLYCVQYIDSIFRWAAFDKKNVVMCYTRSTILVERMNDSNGGCDTNIGELKLPE